MKILVVSLCFFFSEAFACSISSRVQKIYSLSGPVTLALKELDLLRDKKLRGVSIFHPLSTEEFKGEFLPGGVFLSHTKLEQLKGSVVFFDESQELRKILSLTSGIEFVEIKTRGLGPVAVVETLGNTLNKYLSGCDFKQLGSLMQDKLQQLKKLIPKAPGYLFFLGPIKGERLPDMMMVNDGVVKWMIQEKLIHSYPSELAYISWSARIMEALPKGSYKIGIKDSGSENTKEVEKNQLLINLTFPGALIPGMGQVDAMIYLFENLK